MNRRKKAHGIGKWPYIFLAPYVLCYLAFGLYPILYSLYISFTDWNGMNIDQKNFVSFANYARVLSDPLFYKALGNIAKIMIFAVPLEIVLGLLMAQLMLSVTRGRKLVQTLNFLPYITTSVAVGIIFSYLFDWNVGPVNELLRKLHIVQENINWLGSKNMAPVVLVIMTVWKSFGYYMVLYLAGLSTIPSDVLEAATVDGAGAVKKFFYITLPLLRPITVFVVINSLINGLQMFDEVQQLFAGAGNGKGIVGGPERSVLTPVWYFYDVSFKGNSRYGYGAAVAFSLFVVIAVVSLVNVLILNRKEESE